MPVAAGGDSGDAGADAEIDGSAAGNRGQGPGIERNRSATRWTSTRLMGRRHGSAAYELGTFYLVCFLAGLMLSFVSLLGGMGHFGGHVHMPHVTCSHVPARSACARSAWRWRTCTAMAVRRESRAGGSMVERVFDHDFSLLVWRGGLPADEATAALSLAWWWCWLRSAESLEERSSSCF